MKFVALEVDPSLLVRLVEVMYLPIAHHHTSVRLVIDFGLIDRAQLHTGSHDQLLQPSK